MYLRDFALSINTKRLFRKRIKRDYSLKLLLGKDFMNEKVFDQFRLHSHRATPALLEQKVLRICFDYN